VAELHPLPSTTPPGTPLEYTFACQPVSEDVFLGVLGRVVATLDEWGGPWALMGGLASAVYGRPRWTYDVDVFLQPHDAAPALEALGRAGFATDEKDPNWLFKAIDEGVLVDIIFRSVGGIYFDDEMVRRMRRRNFRGVSVPIVAPEDLLVIKAAAFAEHSSRHWYDCLAILVGAELDWDYLLERARHAPSRVASLLLFARSNDIAVPERVVAELVEPAAD
jgi:predicted nucleotidyltransferase